MKKLLLSLSTLALAFSAFAQDYPYATDYFYISDSDWTLMTQFPQEGEGTLNVYFNGLTYKTEAGGDTQYNKVGEMKGPFFGTSNNKNTFHTDENGDNVCISFQNQNTGFSYTNAKSSVTTNAINVASIDYSTKKITLSKAENIELTINGITPFVSPIALQAPEGVSVYEYDSYSNGELFVKLVKNGQIQSNVPVILKSEESKLYVFDFANENFYDYSDVVKSPNSQWKPVYFPDVNIGIIYGVQSPHFISVGSYEFTNDQFTKVETKNTALVNSFSCYLMLPEGTETYPELIEIVFLEEEEPAIEGLYIHFTDENGDYLRTHTELLTVKETISGEEVEDSQKGNEDKVEDGDANADTANSGRPLFAKRKADATGTVVYELENIDLEEDSYFVISAYPFPTSELSAVSNDSWSGFEGTVYHLNGENLEEVDPTEAETITPISKESGKYTVNVTLNSDGSPAAYDITYNGPTSVSTVELTKANSGVIYNVYGQKVDESYRGIVIKDGKKFLQR